MKQIVAGSVFLFTISNASADVLYKMKVNLEKEIFADTNTVVYVEFRDRAGWHQLGICKGQQKSRDLIATLWLAQSKTAVLSIRSTNGLAEISNGNPMDPESNLCVSSAEIEIDEIRN